MLKRIGKGIVVGLGYVLYTLTMTGVCLWLMFPRDALHRLLVRSFDATLAPLQWRVGALAFALPVAVSLEAIEGYSRADKQQPLVRVDSLMVTLDLAMLLREGKIKTDVRMKLAKGTIDGALSLQRRTMDLGFTGTMQGVRVEELAVIMRSMQRDVQGAASGSLSGTLRLKPLALSETLAKFRLEDGRLELKQPVLGHTVLPFTLASATLALKGDRLAVTEGNIDSSLGVGEFTGEIGLQKAWTLSPLAVKGRVQPRPELFKSFADTPPALQAVRQRLKDRPLPFRLSGELGAPAIHFEEFAVLFEALNAESR